MDRLNQPPRKDGKSAAGLAEETRRERRTKRQKKYISNQKGEVKGIKKKKR
jgi:hypothetical protein